MIARPKVQIVRTGTLSEVYVGGKLITDDMDDFARVVRELARALGADVEDAAEPDRQPYTYFIAYAYTAGPHTYGTGSVWHARTEPIENAESEKASRDEILKGNPTFTSVVITNFICTDGPY